jgi:lipopolysaccharide/colanic/teichoic acid biosynthesis glycosyltransferase
MPASLFRVIRGTGGRDLQTGTSQAVRPSFRTREHVRVGDQVLGEGLFREAFVRERRRADRFGTPFAVLVVDRSGSLADWGSWLSILRILAASTRDADAVGWLRGGAVAGVLLPEASGEGALAVMHRVRRQIASRLGDSTLAALSLRLYAHGAEPGPDAAALPSVDLLLDAFAQPRRELARDAAKRGLDILGSLALLALFSPVLLGVFAVVKWTSPGPVLYRQVRVGRWGRQFEMLKFRTMYRNVDHGVHQDYVAWFITSSGQKPRTGNEVFKLTNDKRITRAGHFLRKTSLDELPQFWNVLRGDMSLVGPRPPLPFEVEKYRPWHRRRVLEAKPGVTGPWQVYGRSRTTFDEMVRLDLGYARSHSLWGDIKLLAATPRAMFSGKGAC